MIFKIKIRDLSVCITFGNCCINFKRIENVHKFVQPMWYDKIYKTKQPKEMVTKEKIRKEGDYSGNQ